MIPIAKIQEYLFNGVLTSFFNQRINIDYLSLEVDERYLQPTLSFKFKVTTNQIGSIKQDLIISDLQAMMEIEIGTTKRIIGVAYPPSFQQRWNAGGSYDMILLLTLDNHILTRIDNIRDGKELVLFAKIHFRGYEVSPPGAREEESDYPTIRIEVPQDHWVKRMLPKLPLGKLSIIELPMIELPPLVITKEIDKFLNAAKRASSEGRYGDVFGDCRKALNALYNGIDEWGKTSTLTTEETDYISKGPSDGKDARKREIFFKRLIDNEEKAERLNALRTKLFYCLSLDPHEADYAGIEFTRWDATLMINMTAYFIGSMLNYLVRKLSTS